MTNGFNYRRNHIVDFGMRTRDGMKRACPNQHDCLVLTSQRLADMDENMPTRREFLESIITVPAASLAATLDSGPLAELDEVMQRYVTDRAIPGAALSVAFDGRLLFARGYGLADRETNRICC